MSDFIFNLNLPFIFVVSILIIFLLQSIFSLKPFRRTVNISALKSSAAKGDPRAQYVLACCYLQGRGVDPNFTNAIDLLEKSAGQGFASAQFALGRIYYADKSERHDPKNALVFLKMAVDNGHQPAKQFWNKHKLWRYNDTIIN